jgi:hypothetical protein
VCKCRTPLPARKRPAVFREIRIEQIFSRASTCDLFFAHCRNADELRVFVTRRCLLFCHARAARSAACARFRSRESARSNGFTKPKFFYGEGPETAPCRALRDAKRTNRSDRFASTAPLEGDRDAAQHPREGDFSPTLRACVHRRGDFFARASAEKIALRCRDASSGDR